MLTALVAFAIVAFLSGCAGTPQEKAASVLVEMQMKKTNLIKKDHVPAGLGIGVSKDEQVAMEKADQNARVDLAREIDAQVKALTKNFKEEVGGDIAEHFQSASKTVVDTRLNGATLTDVKIETTEDGQFKIYGIMTLDVSLVEEYLKTQVDTDAANEAMKNKIRAAAEKAYAEIDAETKWPMNSKLVCISLASLVALAVLWGCASNEATVQTQPSVAQAPKVPVSQELNAIACSEGELRGSGLAGDYDQALSYAVSQIATQIQSSVVSTSVMQTRSDVSASGNEEISSSFDRKSQVQAEIRNRQDVHVRETIAHDGVVGVVACMSRADAAKPFREDYLGARDALVAAVAVLSVTSHPLDKFGSYEKVTAAYSKYREALQVLSSLGFNETSAEVEDGYAKAVENYIEFRSKYKVYIDGAFESEEGKILFEQISGDVKLQSLEDSCDVGLVLELEISAPSCKEGALGVSCTEVVALNGKSCKGETYFTLGGTLKGIGRSDENEAKAKLLKSASKNDFVADWKKEISRWFAR